MRKSLYTDDQERLQMMLREVRLSAKMTQSELASRLSRPQSFVAKYEGGERRLDVIELIHVLRALDENPARFVEMLATHIA